MKSEKRLPTDNRANCSANQPTNQPTNQSTKELTAGGDLRESASRRPSVCLAIPALIASLGSVTDTLTTTWVALTLTISRRG